MSFIISGITLSFMSAVLLGVLFLVQTLLVEARKQKVVPGGSDDRRR
ncbi:MAG: hypothetical protein J2P36_20800 [Ktedonobacteraceae bacterium]|nr:hypothetical protein [Ktedonobacteraceae bacterium]